MVARCKDILTIIKCHTSNVKHFSPTGVNKPSITDPLVHETSGENTGILCGNSDHRKSDSPIRYWSLKDVYIWNGQSKWSISSFRTPREIPLWDVMR